jgi:putative sterol carrier protein
MAYTIHDGMEAIAGRFQAEAAYGLNAVIQFDLTGDQAATYHMTIRDQHLTLKEGPAGNADLILTMDTADFLDLMTGKLEGTEAFVSGKLKVSGDMMLAMQLAGIFFSR